MKTRLVIVVLLVFMACGPASLRAQSWGAASHQRAPTINRGISEIAAEARAAQQARARMQRSAPEPARHVPVYRVVNGVVYDATRSDLWVRLENCVILQWTGNLARVETRLPNPLLNGTVISVADDGVLVMKRGSDEPCFVKMDAEGYVDGRLFSKFVVPDGTYSYVAVSGAKRTVRAYILAEKLYTAIDLGWVRNVHSIGVPIGSKKTIPWMYLFTDTETGAFDAGLDLKSLKPVQLEIVEDEPAKSP